MNFKASLVVSVFVLGLFACGPDKKEENAGTEPSPQEPRSQEPSPQGSTSKIPLSTTPQISAQKNYSVNAKWLHGPVFKHVDGKLEESKVVLYFTRPDLQKLNSVNLEKVEPWMKIHGHGTRRKVPLIKRLDSDSFEVTNIFFTMGGPWA